MSWDHHADELCDLKAATGDYPGLIGFNVKDLIQADLDVTQELTRRAYARGSLISISMAMSNPVTGGSLEIEEDDQTKVINSTRKILPGGSHHAKYQSVLDRLADFAHNLTDSDGKYIPIAFRPFHENNANWFWWGMNNAAQNTFEDYINLWQFTVKYLRDTKEVHNFLYVYAPTCRYKSFYEDGDFSAYTKTYAGDDYVDILAFDCYYGVKEEERVPFFVERVQELVKEAQKRGKISAIAEMGLNSVKTGGINKYPDFWMERVLSPLKNTTDGTGLGYIMTWTNRCASSDCTIWTPYPGHKALDEFLTFYNDNITLFNADLPNLYT